MHLSRNRTRKWSKSYYSSKKSPSSDISSNMSETLVDKYSSSDNDYFTINNNTEITNEMIGQNPFKLTDIMYLGKEFWLISLGA